MPRPRRAGLAEPWRDLQAQADAAGVALLLRINGADTSYFAEDLAFAARAALRRSCCPRPTRRRWPPARRTARDAVLRLLERRQGLRSGDVARAPGVSRLLFGSIDLMFDLDVGDDDAPLHHFRSELVMHSRAAGLPAPVDGVCTAIGDADALAADTRAHGVSALAPSC
jgi:citrate lyase subunit beta/citryl-CoA lyase